MARRERSTVKHSDSARNQAHRVLLLPGTSSATATDRYRDVYTTIEREAERRDMNILRVSYPGQDGPKSGSLTFRNACQRALEAASQFRPTRIIARSLGCNVAVQILSSGKEWLTDCQAAVLWGPATNAAVVPYLASPERNAKFVKSYADHGTYLAQDLLVTTPAFEYLIGGAAVDIRLARGTRDPDNCVDDLRMMAAAHKDKQKTRICEIVEIAGLGHDVSASRTTMDVLGRYFDGLFDPIVRRI